MPAVPVIEIESFGIVVGLAGSRPACLILSCEGMSAGADQARASIDATLIDKALHLSGPKGTLVLKDLGEAIRQAAQLKLPIVVLDPANDHEHMIKVITQGSAIG